MASASPSQSTGSRPGPLRPTKSFPRPESKKAASSASTRPQRASTIQNGATPQPKKLSSKSQKSEEREALDAFESGTADADDTAEAPRASVDLDDIPIELVSLIDTFIDSLSAKVHALPPTIGNVSRLFQEFYALAASHINTHIATLAARQQRESSPAPSASSRASAASLLRGKAGSLSSKELPRTPPVRTESEQQMLTAEEFADRKRARKALEQKRGLLEEGVERRLCEGIYDRIYRHRTTQDEAQDDKLRSKTAALAVVGIGPADLGIDLGVDSSQSPEAAAERVREVREWLGQARKELVLMHEKRYPYGKLNHLKAAHKSIVDTLSHFHPSSSADEIMPMLIYTLVTMPPEDLNVISDLHFIQRFRWEQKLVGEGAYCLTNLEAAISFLETVDLSTLRADEAPSGPLKASSRPGTPRTETFPPAYSPGLSAPLQSAAETSPGTAAAIKPVPSPSGLRAAVQLRNRRLSDLVNTPALALNAASDAVLSTADQSLKTIGASLGDSYKFLIGRLRDGAATGAGPGSDVMVVPKTLDDARKLIGTPPPDDDNGSASGASSVHGPEDADTQTQQRQTMREDRAALLSLIGGRKASRDHSADSSRSASSSSKKVIFDGAAGPTSAAAVGNTSAATVAGAGGAAPSYNPAIMDSVRNLGTSFNPMARIAGLGGFRGFGRTASTPPAPIPAAAAKALADGGDLSTAFPDIAAALPPKEVPVPKIAPPVRRFMELQNPADLRIGEVLELLRDYRRLAGALKDMGAF